MTSFQLSIIVILAVLNGAVPSLATYSSCKCSPATSCWPSPELWTALNTSVSGKLIRNVPVAAPCYPGALYNAAQCAAVDAQWSDAAFQAQNPVGLSYPVEVSCPPVNASAGQLAGTCGIGGLPWYTVNATKAEDVVVAVRFARRWNVRVVVRDTGHDLLGRSEGYGSLEVWVRYLRTGLEFEQSYASSSNCDKSTWNGSAITIGGGYTWSEVYPFAESKDVIVVGGGTPSVGCLGGWMQGGGHGPLSQHHGLGADQVLSLRAVLASGEIVTADPCTHADLFFALRGGGPGTYAIVVSTTVKAYPDVKAVAQHVALAPLGPGSNTSALLDAIAILWSAYPNLNDAGYAGYGAWGIDAAAPFFANFTSGYVHGFYTFGGNVTQGEAEAAFAPVAARLAAFNGTSLFVSVGYVTYASYWPFYRAESGTEPAVGSPAIVGSRLFDRRALQDNATALRGMLDVLAGAPGQGVANDVELVGGGQVFRDASDVYSGVNPAWRSSYMNNIVSRAYLPSDTAAEVLAKERDITEVKVAAMKRVAPHTGAYMNEADRNDPEWTRDFYGGHWGRLEGVKRRYDPEGVLYCPTCVGSEAWVVEASCALCRR